MAGDHTTNDPWERQDSESPAAFSAFAAYRDMGPARSITKVARQVDKSRTLIGRWSRAHAWVLRAQAFDREQDRLFAAEQRQARKEAARRHAKLAQAFLGKAVARLQTLDPRELTPSDLLRYFATAAEIERRAVGDDLVGLEHAATDGSGVVDAETLTDEERRARMQQLRRELERRIGQEDAT
ncbi:hypothetical protein Sipo8835_22930 [Streptomyces ipomoeae]|uniref:Uncharacterized protein n=1 Tax=Streptomyces ipomoeae TaxID=103232 RepID=A0AAE8W2T5_9ACTN|nr:hypothetical protein [Streptomyces ipomoeae]TQE30934.1 hypothetical protein Sipo8835_22930 [Streptomyces ipomoeae]